MKSLPAEEFLNQHTSAYGAPWAEVFYDLTNEPLCAMHMAEFIDDLERYGQQTPVYVDNDGMVDEGNRIAMGLAVLGEDVEFVIGTPPDWEDSQLWEVEFDIVSGDAEHFFNHIEDVFSFRCEDDWVVPLDAAMGGEEVCVTVFCRSGEFTADRLAPEISKRLERLAGVVVAGMRVSMPQTVDEDTSEW